MTVEDVKARYAQEPWGKFLLEIGMEPYATESQARSVASHAAERLGKMEAEVKAMQEVLKECEEYFDQRADADQPSGSQPIPNDEMNLLTTVRAALGEE